MINHLFKMFDIVVVFLFICLNLLLQILYVKFQLFDDSIWLIWNIKSMFDCFNEDNWLRIYKGFDAIDFWFV